MSNIEWTDATWNPVTGCTRVSPGCDHCYAVTMTHRLEGMERARRPRNGTEDGCGAKPGEKYTGLTVLNGRGDRHFNGVVRCHEDALSIPMKWKQPKRIFVNSMADLFHKDVPFEFIDRVSAMMAMCQHHRFQILTKRPEQMQEYWRDPGRLTMVAQAAALMGFGEESMSIQLPLPNVWLGTSVERQQEADERIPHLLRCPAAVRGISLEPMLDRVDLDRWLYPLVEGGIGKPETVVRPRLDWVIVGGESGPGARPCNVAWIRSIVKQCKAAGVPCFVKQLGSWPTSFRDEECLMKWNWDDGGENIERWYKPINKKGGDMAEWPEDLRIREMPTATKA